MFAGKYNEKEELDWSCMVRSEGLLKIVLEERMEGKRTRGRPRMGMIDDLMEGTYAEMKRRAENRES